MFELRDYQSKCVESIINSFKDNDKVGIVLPTGGGKTEIFIEVCRHHLQQHPSSSVLLLSHLSLLTRQTHDRFQLRYPEISVGILQANTYPKEKVDVIISTMQSSRNEEKMSGWIAGLSLFDKAKVNIGLVIIDEAHYLYTSSYDKALEQFGDIKVLGVTATPYRDGKLMTNYFQDVPYTLSLQDLIEDGYLVKPDLHGISMPRGGGDVNEKMARVANIYLEKEKNKSAVIFMDTIKNAKAMKMLLSNEGISARCVTSDVSGTSRDAILDDFRKGNTKVLTTVNVLTAGFDAPIMECVFMPFSTNSPTLYMQRIGRGLRPYPGKKSCRIYCFGDAPSIKRGVYYRIHELALTGGSRRKPDDPHKLLEYLELTGKKSSEEYHWTADLCTAVDKLRHLSSEGLEKLIIKKQFPRRYLSNLPKLIAALPENAKLEGTEALPTDRQKKTLKMNGFTEKQIEQMNKIDASNMIAAIINMRAQWKAEGKFIVPSGKYMGKHVKELPPFYKRYVLMNYPHSNVASLIMKYKGD